MKVKDELEKFKKDLIKITKQRTMEKDEETYKVLTETEFNLSDQWTIIHEDRMYYEDDVKEFIVLLKEDITSSINLAKSFNESTVASILQNRLDIINKLAGDKLNGV